MAKLGKWQEKYEKMDELGKGGNATVYQVKCKNDNKEYALKELTNRSGEKKKRFIDEINIMKDNYTEIEGIISIIRDSIEEYWYTMPIAQSALEYLNVNKIDIKGTVEYVIQLCETLEDLHEKEISHRDIKPANIYFYENRFCLGDFGLVEYLESTNNCTRSDRGLGAIFTIAPEMKRNPKGADGKKADVFSLGKTLWMFLTKNEKGFDGVYNYLDSNHSLRCIDEYKQTHLVELEELLKDATDNSPDSRPTIIEFKERLKKWLEIYSDVDKSQASDWSFLNKQLFGQNPPDSSSWRNIHKIVEVLNIVGKNPAYNHMLFHNKGGLDFSCAEIAPEYNCIKLYDEFGFCHVVKPRKLYFEGFDINYNWNYFLLELDELIPVLGDDNDSDTEYLVEDVPGHYASAQYSQYGVYDYEKGNKLPVGFQEVYRYTKGKLLIVMKRGPYNQINATYDGRHGDCTADKFREYIDSLIKRYIEIFDYAKKQSKLKRFSEDEIESRILHSKEFNKNPFKSNDFNTDYNTEIITERVSNEKKRNDYISQTFANWNFSHIFRNYVSTDSPVIKFIFKFVVPNSDISLKSFTSINNYICTDGKIRVLNSCNDEQCYCVYDRKTAIDMKYKIEKNISEILEENKLLELDEYETYFEIELVRLGKPIHIFTKEEIQEEMRKADDRVHNQLIIDEEGYAKVIKNEGFGYLFPVRHETWNAGNVYVGKYSKLSTLEDDYISSLQGWLLYLKTGCEQNMDYVHGNRNEEEILKEIKQYY